MSRATHAHEERQRAASERKRIRSIADTLRRVRRRREPTRQVEWWASGGTDLLDHVMVMSLDNIDLATLVGQAVSRTRIAIARGQTEAQALLVCLSAPC